MKLKKKSPQLQKKRGEKKSSWNKNVKDSDFEFLDSQHQQREYLKIVLFTDRFPLCMYSFGVHEYFNVWGPPNNFIKNGLISEDAICKWEKMRIRKKQVFLSRMRITDFLLEAEKKMCLYCCNQKVVLLCCAIQESVNTGIDHIFLGE